MSFAVTLDCIDVLITPSHADHLAFFDRHIKQFKQNGTCFDSVIMASSSDLTFLLCEYSQARLLQVLEAFPEAKADLVTQGCLGLYASVMHFISDPAVESALVIMLETPFESLQAGLNASKLGQAFGQNGMLAKPGVGLCRLQKKKLKDIAEHDLIIDVAEILAKAHGLNANASFLKRIIERVHGLHQQLPSKMVSFAIRADLSDLFMKFLQPELNKLGLNDRWLASFEQDNTNVFSLKPLLEIQHYAQHLQEMPLITFGLGAGGRLGVLRLSRVSHLKKMTSDIRELDLCPCQNPVSIEQSLTAHYQKTLEVIEAFLTEEEFYQRGKAAMLTLDKAHMGIDNMYFRMPLSIQGLRGIRPARSRAMENFIPDNKAPFAAAAIAMLD